MRSTQYNCIPKRDTCIYNMFRANQEFAHPRIAQCKLEIHTLPRNPRIAQPIPLLSTCDIDTSLASYKNATLGQYMQRLCGLQAISFIHPSLLQTVDCQNNLTM